MSDTPKTNGIFTNVPSQTLHTLVLVFGGLTLLLIGFVGGQAYEHDHVRQLTGWRDNYQRNFFGNPSMEGNGPPGVMMGLPRVRTHGLLGKVLSVDNDKITVQDRDGTEQSVATNNNTVYRQGTANAARPDIKAGLQIAVFGQPNDKGQIVAKLIRLFNTNENPLP